MVNLINKIENAWFFLIKTLMFSFELGFWTIWGLMEIT